MNDFEQYSKEVEEATNNISLKISSTTDRRGKSRLRDRLVFGKYAWQESLSFVGIIQSVIIFMALIPASVISINEFFTLVKIPVVLPIHISSIVAVAFIIFVFFFGFLAVRYIGTITSAAEIGAKMSPGNYLLWKQLHELKTKVEKIEQKQKGVDNR